MGRVITFLSAKGGVGKTTLCVNTADMLARRVSGSDKVLLIDLDAQASATLYVLGYDSQQRHERDERTVYNFLLKLWEEGDVKLDDYVVKAPSSSWSERLYIVPGDAKIMELERKAVATGGAWGRGWLGLLKHAVDKFREKGFEYIFIDPPATLGVLSTMALAACDYFIIPIVPDDFGRASFRLFMSDFFNRAAYEIVKQGVRGELPLCGGVVFNKLLPQSKKHPQIADEIEREILSRRLYGRYPVPVYKTRLREYIAYAKALDEHKPIDKIKDAKEAQDQFRQFFNEFYDYVIKGKAGRDNA